jgi:lipopolysaccharide biosynthesis regulator YciM
MEFELQWVLVALPVAFALGWVASRFDLRQLRRQRRDAPRAYFDGLNLLLNEQQDKAIDAFIEAVQLDPDTAELHFALGNLFRRRGEFERAVRVHEHLAQRGDLSAADRDRARHALAQDYMKAGLFDRAEHAWRVLEGTRFDTDARLALLSLAERSRDWPEAIRIAQRIPPARGGSMAARLAHYECEQALAADARGDAPEAAAALARARAAAPDAPRPLLLAGQRAARAGDAETACRLWDELREQHPTVFLLVAVDYAAAARACGQAAPARAALAALHDRLPAIELMRALLHLDEADGSPGVRDEDAARLTAQLRRQPSLSTAQLWLAQAPDKRSAEGLAALHDALARAARPLQRYRCAACGFEAAQHFWQCPGCLSWDSYPPQQLDAL